MITSRELITSIDYKEKSFVTEYLIKLTIAARPLIPLASTVAKRNVRWTFFGWSSKLYARFLRGNLKQSKTY